MSDEAKSFFESLPERIPAERLVGLSVVYVFEVSGDSAWTVRVDDGGLHVYEEIDPAADCTITASEDVFRRLVGRELNPVSAYLTGKIQIRGDLGAAMRLSELLSS